MQNHEQKYGKPVIDVPREPSTPEGRRPDAVGQVETPPPPVDNTFVCPSANIPTVATWGEDDIKNPSDLDAIKQVRFQLGANKHVYVWITCENEVTNVWLEGASTMTSASTTVMPFTFLFAFGTGTWSKTKAADNIAFEFNADTDYLTMVSTDKSKKSAMLCQIVHDFYTNGKDCEIAFHEKTPKVKPETREIVPHRFDVSIKPGAGCFFTPDAIDVADRRANNQEIQSVEAGALFKNKMQQLPCTHGFISFDCFAARSDTKDGSTVFVRPKHPKFSTKVKMTIPKMKCVRLL